MVYKRNITYSYGHASNVMSFTEQKVHTSIIQTRLVSKNNLWTLSSQNVVGLIHLQLSEKKNLCNMEEFKWIWAIDFMVKGSVYHHDRKAYQKKKW